jgi:hypothetical protein
VRFRRAVIAGSLVSLVGDRRRERESDRDEHGTEVAIGVHDDLGCDVLRADGRREKVVEVHRVVLSVFRSVEDGRKSVS